MTILQSWKSSLSLFAPANFVQLMREIAQSIVATYKVLLQHWYLFLLVVPELLPHMFSSVKYNYVGVDTFVMRTKFYGVVIPGNGVWLGVPIFDLLLFLLYITFIVMICLAARFLR